MGGKNPGIVMPTADLGAAANGVARSAFGYAGQKCSACSRVYVHRDAYHDSIKADAVMYALVEAIGVLAIALVAWWASRELGASANAIAMRSQIAF